MNLSKIPYGSLIFLITLLIVISAPWYSDIYYQIRKKLFNKMTRREQEDWAVQVHFDLYNKLLGMLYDPFMSDQKFREWLPICQYADEMLKSILPKTNLTSLESLIHKIIDAPNEITI